MPHCCNYSSAWWWAKTIRRQLVVLRREAVQLTLLCNKCLLLGYLYSNFVLQDKQSLKMIWCVDQ